MDHPLIVWAKLTLRLGIVLAVIGVVPALLFRYIFTEFDALIPALLLFTVAPLGGLILAVSLILFLAAWARRPSGPA
jgi:hypothetical protein